MHVFNPTNSNGNGLSAAVTGAGPHRAATAMAAATDPGSTLPSPAANSGASATSTATITANDFLQLLVAELKNQDPTANTDPNEYVDQLVQVNSLQQEIQMNQTLDGGPTLTGASSGVLQQLMQMNNTLDGVAGPSSSSSGSEPAAAVSRLQSDARSHEAASAGGQNTVSNPATEASAETVANALTANPHEAGPGVSKMQIPASQMGAFAEFAARLRANHAGGARP